MEERLTVILAALLGFLIGSFFHDKDDHDKAYDNFGEDFDYYGKEFGWFNQK